MKEATTVAQDDTVTESHIVSVAHPLLAVKHTLYELSVEKAYVGFCELLVLPSPKFQNHDVVLVDASANVTVRSLLNEVNEATGGEHAVTVILAQILSMLHGLVTTKHTVYVPGAG